MATALANRLSVGIDTIIHNFREQHPEDKRWNDHLGGTIFRAAKKFDPTSRTTGQRPSLFRGVNGLPKSSEVMDITPATLAYLFQLCQQGFKYEPPVKK